MLALRGANGDVHSGSNGGSVDATWNYARATLVAVVVISGMAPCAYASIIYARVLRPIPWTHSARGVLRCCLIAALVAASAVYYAVESRRPCMLPQTSWGGFDPAVGDAVGLCCCIFLTGVAVDVLLLWESLRVKKHAVGGVVFAALVAFCFSGVAENAWAFVLLRAATHALACTALLLLFSIDFSFSPEHAEMRRYVENVRAARHAARHAARQAARRQAARRHAARS
jgi:hypothetical protein